MSEIQTAIDNFAIWKAVLWCFYPFIAFLAWDFGTRLPNDNDDDDFDGGMMVPVYQTYKN